MRSVYAKGFFVRILFAWLIMLLISIVVHNIFVGLILAGIFLSTTIIIFPVELNPIEHWKRWVVLLVLMMISGFVARLIHDSILSAVVGILVGVGIFCLIDYVARGFFHFQHGHG